MTTATTWIWIILVFLLLLAGIRRLMVRRAHRQERPFELDDAAIARIVRHGSLSTSEDDPLDEEEIARAEEEFWEQSWDEPEDYGR